MAINHLFGQALGAFGGGSQAIANQKLFMQQAEMVYYFNATDTSMAFSDLHKPEVVLPKDIVGKLERIEGDAIHNRIKRWINA